MLDPSSVPACAGGRALVVSHPWSGEAVALLTDGLLHNARNPLNALSIHLEVLTERLRREHKGEVPPAHDKNLRTMREQVQRVDEILRQFAEFLVPLGGSGAVGDGQDLSSWVARALDVVGHECRKRQVQLRASIEPSTRVLTDARGALSQLVLQSMVLAVSAARVGSVLNVEVRHASDGVHLRVEGAVFDADQVRAQVEDCRRLSERCGGTFDARSDGLELRLPVATDVAEGVEQ